MRRIVGNLDCERAWAGAGRLSSRALQRIATLATLLRAFAESPDDALWTPAPVDPARLAPTPGLPHPRLVTGPLDALEPAGRMIAWGETKELAAGRGSAAGRRRALATHIGSLIHEQVWDWRISPPEAAAQVNHRQFGLAVARELGWALPGARMIRSADELAAHLASGGADASRVSAWVLKAPWSAAGRERVVGTGCDLGDDALRRRVEGLLHRWQTLLFEPWMPRIGDYGACGLVSDADVRLIGIHRQHVDARGGFQGIDLVRDAGAMEAQVLGLSEPEHASLKATLADAGRALAGAGYRGPYGIDAWRYRDRAGRVAFQPLGEINARMTFGLVARALAERVGAAAGWPREAVVGMRLGKLEHASSTPWVAENDSEGAAVAGAPLLWPSADDPTAAWLALGDGD